MNDGVNCFLFVIRMDDHESKTKVSRKRMMPNATVHHIPCEIEYTVSRKTLTGKGILSTEGA